MKRLDHCEICGRLSYPALTSSLIDQHMYWACSSCLEAHAVSWPEIANWTRGHEWSELPVAVRSVVTVWIDETYMPALDGMRRLLHQQVVLVPEPEIELDAEDEELFQSMRRKIMELGLYLDGDLPAAPQLGFFRRILSWT